MIFHSNFHSIFLDKYIAQYFKIFTTSPAHSNHSRVFWPYATHVLYSNKKSDLLDKEL